MLPSKTKKAVPVYNMLLEWYDGHRRYLPWRAESPMAANPYHVWLSEIMLQQTTVVTVTPYFKKFIERWPRLDDLARTNPDNVMRLWAGLGYYRRARMLHQCAQTVRDEYGGEFPRTEQELIKLPGFGPYTAAAVAAIAFDKKANVVDGNVERVMARLFAIEQPLPKAKKILKEKAASLLPNKRFGDYAQALMDLGATVCTPRSPKCDLCPIQKFCQAKKLNIQTELPRKRRKTAKPARHAIAYVMTDSTGRVFLRQRPDKGLLGGMMEVPSSPWESASPAKTDLLRHQPAPLSWDLCDGNVRHVFSHFDLSIRVARAKAGKKKIGQGRWVAEKDLPNEALPSVMRKILRHAGLKA